MSPISLLAQQHAWSNSLQDLGIRSLGTALLALGKQVMLQLLRRVASRRRGRWEVSLVNAILLLLKTDPRLWQWLDPHCTLGLEAALPNVS